MNNLRFRAWLTKEKKMVKVQKLHLDERYPYSMGIAYDRPTPTSDEPYYFCYFKNCILMQSTGLRDKSKVEIWEGDIIKKRCYDGTKPYDFIGLVVWDHEGFCLKRLDTLYSFGRYDEGKKLLVKEEVIGNLYQNPELLGESK